MSNEKDKTNRPRRSRKFSAVTYLSEQQLQEVLRQHNKNIKAYAYILHDKDEDKKSHRHILLTTVNATTKTAIKAWFSGHVDALGLPINTMVEEMHDAYSCWCYLTHRDSDGKKLDGKAEYSPEDIKGFNTDIYIDEASNDKDTITCAVEDLLDGLTLREVATKYGRDFIIHYHSIKLLLNDILIQESEDKEECLQQ